MIYTIGNAKDNVRIGDLPEFVEQLGSGGDCGTQELVDPPETCNSTL